MKCVKKGCVAFSTHSSFANNFLTLLDHPLISIRQEYVGKLFKTWKKHTSMLPCSYDTRKNLHHPNFHIYFGAILLCFYVFCSGR